MTNIPILPIVPKDPDSNGDTADNDPGEREPGFPLVDATESPDSQATVDKDLKEGNSVNEKLDE